MIVKFVCENADDLSGEFQQHLISRKVIDAEVKPESRGSEVWLNMPAVQPDTIKRVEEEARPWCLDRGLGLMRSPSEAGTSQPAILMIGDLLQVMG